MTSAHPLLRCLLIYRTMPWRFSLTLSLFIAVNGSLAWYQHLIGQAVHEAELGRLVTLSPDGQLNFERAIHWASVLLGVAGARAVLQYLGGIASLHTGQELLFRLRDSILVQVQRLDMGYHLRHGIGEVVARTTRDADKVRDALVSFWRNVIETGLVIVASLAMLFWYSPWLASLPLLLTLLGIALFMRQADKLVLLDRAVGDAYDSVSQDLVEGVGGVRVIKSFGLERIRIERFNRAVQTFREHAARAIRYSATRVPIPQMGVALGQVWVLGVGAWLVGRAQLNLGELVACTLAMNTLIFRFEGIGRVIQIFADARASAARIMEFLDAPTAIESGTRTLPAGALGFSLQGVEVTTDSARKAAILSKCNLEVRPGETVALVGATGSGKSTLAALLPRLVDPNSGCVSIGSEGGQYVSAKELALSELRSRVHVATQECFLFSDTVAANLAFARPSASDEELLEALRVASAEDVVTSHPDGLLARIGDRGMTLSGGQRQRLALARAVLAQPSILVLDDSTSALDAVTEQSILHNLKRYAERNARKFTLLLIASKPSTVRFAERVVVLEGGAIKAEGTHEQLAATSATFRELMGM